MQSRGDPRVHFVMNLLLSAAFVYMLLRGLEFLDVVAFSLVRFAIGTLLLMAITHVVTQ
ncbi:hypothetical protein [Salinarchaeum laminariae]|uniref:hypothetical protein n=1 Tax=Salinarchaeum laminariae TaxID=869888 RepID=UPI0020C03713|nr:hypothetical protein [Salinarchaeum laminariae]